MNNIAIITARSGSKGLKDKNILPLAGMPLIAYSIIAARESRVFRDVMVSTDSDHYASIAKEYGASVPFLRSKELSGDLVGSWDVVKEVLEKYRTSFDMRFDTVCLLQPTSPLRSVQDIIGGYQEFEEKHADSVTAVCEMEHSPLWSMTLPRDLSLKEYLKKSEGDLPRQKLPTYYRINGALYIRRIEYHSDGSISLPETEAFAYIMPRERSIDIDTRIDFRLAEILMKDNL
jgi:CMP-N,N'-diacetyllegionaminic acid synthase